MVFSCLLWLRIISVRQADEGSVRFAGASLSVSGVGRSSCCGVAPPVPPLRVLFRVPPASRLKDYLNACNCAVFPPTLPSVMQITRCSASTLARWASAASTWLALRAALMLPPSAQVCAAAGSTFRCVLLLRAVPLPLQRCACAQMCGLDVTHARVLCQRQ